MNFKNSNGVLITKGLFLEVSYESPENVVYTLKDEDYEYKGRLLPSLYKLYMHLNDPTEWKVATECFHGWSHWEAICNSSWFAPYIKSWREQLELRLKSQALARIMAEAKASSKDALQANKYLLEKKWIEKDATKGRPTKEAIRKEAEFIRAEDTEFLLADVERFGLQPKTGGTH